MNPNDSIGTLLRRFLVLSQSEMLKLRKATAIGNMAAIAEIDPVIAVGGIYPSGQVVVYSFATRTLMISPTFEDVLVGISDVEDWVVFMEEQTAEGMVGGKLPIQ